MPTPQHLHIPAGPHLTLHALAWGPEDGRPVIALHGWLDNAATWSRAAPLLEGLRIIALDFAGHGLSDRRPPGAFYHYIENVADVIRAADSLGWQRFSLLGHSMGAGVSTLIAGAVPDRIERAVFVEGLGPMSNEPKQLPALVGRSLSSYEELSGREPRVYASREDARAKLAKANPSLTSEAVYALVERGTREVDGGVVFRHDPRLRGTSLFRFSEPQVHAYLKAIKAPTLLIRARQGWPFDAEHMQARRDCISEAREFAVDGGHHVHLDHPESVVPVIQEHLQG